MIFTVSDFPERFQVNDFLAFLQHCASLWVYFNSSKKLENEHLRWQPQLGFN
jgi:hypothetical protein